MSEFKEAVMTAVSHNIGVITSDEKKEMAKFRFKTISDLCDLVEKMSKALEHYEENYYGKRASDALKLKNKFLEELK